MIMSVVGHDHLYPEKRAELKRYKLNPKICQLELTDRDLIKQMTEGVIDTSKNSPPSYLNWARTLNHLLEDRDGVELFKKYVEEEAPAYNDHLNFYFACEGLKQQTDPEKVKQIIGAIYR